MNDMKYILILCCPLQKKIILFLLTDHRCQSHQMCNYLKLLLQGALNYQYHKQSENARKNTKRLNFHDLNICPNILHVDADADKVVIAISAALKCSHAINYESIIKPLVNMGIFPYSHSVF